MAAVESVQFFQFDAEGNMYVFEPGAGCTGQATLVKPGDEMIFNKTVEFHDDSQVMKEFASELKSTCDSGVHCTAPSSQRSFHEPLKQVDLEELKHKKFVPETMKKVNWVVKMFKEWRSVRNKSAGYELITCDLNRKDTITVESIVFALTRFVTEIKKIDGNEYPSKTLYEIIISFQFYLETLGFAWK